MSAPLPARLSRRSFLKLGAAAAAASAFALQLPRLAAIAASASLATPAPALLRVKSALPLPGCGYLPFPERLLWQPLDRIDVALVPAYVAALLIGRGLLQPIPGQPGRAHDPEGHYTVPYAYRVAALPSPNQTGALKAAAWADLWSAAGQAVWPASGRLIVGAALLRRGYSPNDTHPGHLAQAAADLAQLRPRIAPEHARRFNQLERTQRPLAFVMVDPAQVGPANGPRLPIEGTMLVEYDWVITAGPAQAAAARQFVDTLRPAAPPLRPDLPVRLIPLMPLPESARAQQAEIWASLTA